MREPVHYIEFAEHKLAVAERIHGVAAYEVAAREAYLAAMNAARGVIYMKTGKITKTHKGVRALFLRLIHEGMAFDDRLAEFLTTGFELRYRLIM